MARACPSSRERWLDEALAVLATHGHEGLRAEPLSGGCTSPRELLLALRRRSVFPPCRARTLGSHCHRPAARDRGATAAPQRGWPRRQPGSPDRHRLHRPARSGESGARLGGGQRGGNQGRRRREPPSAVPARGHVGQGGLSRQEAEASAAVLYWAYLGRVLYPDLPVSKARLAQVKARLGLEGGSTCGEAEPGLIAAAPPTTGQVMAANASDELRRPRHDEEVARLDRVSGPPVEVRPSRASPPPR